MGRKKRAEEEIQGEERREAEREGERAKTSDPFSLL